MNGINRRAVLRGIVSLPAIVSSKSISIASGAAPKMNRDLNGLGMIYLDDQLVYFDTNQRHIAPGDMALVLVSKTQLAVRQYVHYSHLGTPHVRSGYINIAYPEGRYFRGQDLGYDCVREVPVVGRVIKIGAA